MSLVGDGALIEERASAGGLVLLLLLLFSAASPLPFMLDGVLVLCLGDVPFVMATDGDVI